jgi:glycosyltransferase involved in cell wall biosynthesis
LIQAFSLIKSACPRAKLMIIGKGELEAELKTQAAALGLHQDVIFTGFLNHGFRYMKAFDSFVLSSKQEAFGRVLLEAMIAKVPVIATRVHGIPEVVGDAGLLVNAGDAVTLANCMQQIYNMPAEKHEELTEKAYQRMAEQFSIPVFKEHFAKATTF